MISRGDEETAAADRVRYDRKAFGPSQLEEVSARIPGVVIKTDDYSAEQVLEMVWSEIRKVEKCTKK